MSKIKKTLETCLDLTPSLKTSVDARVESLVSNVDYLENRHRNFIQKKYGRKRRLPHTHVLFSGEHTFCSVIFLFVWTFYNLDYS